MDAETMPYPSLKVKPPQRQDKAFPTASSEFRIKTTLHDEHNITSPKRHVGHKPDI